MDEHTIVAHKEWIEARKDLLAEEKRFTMVRDELSRRRRELPWEAVDKEYIFEGPDGTRTLPELFDDRSQLIVYHFMFDPDWDEGCPHCSLWADNFDPNVVHMNAHDVTLVAISRAPFPKLAAYRQRMGWSFPWVSSSHTDFNFDFGASFMPATQANGGVYNYRRESSLGSEREGVSVFYRDEVGGVFHTYSTYARGIDMLNSAYNYLDLTPKGRDEEGRDPQYWVRRHDEYAR